MIGERTGGRQSKDFDLLPAVELTHDRTSAEQTATRLTVRNLVIFCGVAVGFVMVLARAELLPDRFFYDGNKIQRIIDGSVPLYGDEAFESVASLYASLGLGGLPILAGLLGWLSYLAIIGVVVWRCRTVAPSIQVSLMLFIALVVGSVYLGYYGKELFVLPIVALVTLLGPGLRNEIILIAAMLLYSFTLRDYWVLIVAIYCALRLLWHLSPRLPTLLLGMVATVVLVSVVGFDLILGVAPDNFRILLNASRIGDPDAQSMIEPIIAGGSLPAGIFNVLSTLLFLIVPIPLLLEGGLYYWVLAGMFVFLWLTFFSGLRKSNVAGNVNDALRARAITLVTAFVVVQAFFEPDYGSALRHISPMLPLMVLVAWSGARKVTKA